VDEGFVPSLGRGTVLTRERLICFVSTVPNNSNLVSYLNSAKVATTSVGFLILPSGRLLLISKGIWLYPTPIIIKHIYVTLLEDLFQKFP
jgi:hypothetical protein